MSFMKNTRSPNACALLLTILYRTALQSLGVSSSRFTLNFVLFLLSLDSVLGMVPKLSFYRHVTVILLADC